MAWLASAWSWIKGTKLWIIFAAIGAFFAWLWVRARRAAEQAKSENQALRRQAERRRQVEDAQQKSQAKHVEIEKEIEEGLAIKVEAHKEEEKRIDRVADAGSLAGELNDLFKDLK